MRSYLLNDITAPYSLVESWIYDTFIAPGMLACKIKLMNPYLKLIEQNASILDVGCGGGQLIQTLARIRPDLKLTGLDLSKELIAKAKKRTQMFGDRVKFIEGSALALPFVNDSFNYVVSIASLKHWPDRKKGLEECTRVLMPKGKFLVAEANKNCSYDETRKFVKTWRIPFFLKPIGIRIFVKKVAGQSLDKAGMNLILRSLKCNKFKLSEVPNLPALVAVVEKL